LIEPPRHEDTRFLAPQAFITGRKEDQKIKKESPTIFLSSRLPVYDDAARLFDVPDVSVFG